jgi:hypothetical protein
MRIYDQAENSRSLNNSVGDNSWFRSMTWRLVEPGRLARADTPPGSYFIEVQPNGEFLLTFDPGSGARACPTKFQAINRAQGEADDHHRRLVAQQHQPARMKPPKW